MLRTLCLFVFFATSNTFASLDSYLEAAMRSYPSFGGATALNIGYNQALLGSISKDNIWYSMLRLNLEANTSVVVHHYDYSLTIYPISFMALGAGRREMQSDYEEFSNYDCDDVRCTGELNKDYVFGKIILSYSDIVFNHKYQVSRNSYENDDNSDKPVAEYLSLTEVDPNNEIEVTRQYFIGYKLENNYLGIFSEYIEYLESNQYSQMDLLAYNINMNPLSFTLGAGAFKSSEIDPGGIFIFSIRYEFMENLALF